MRNRLFVRLLLCICLGLAACGPEKPAAVQQPAEPEKPPEIYRVRFETTKGEFVVEVTRAWAPRGADHFYELVKTRFYDGARFFRVIRGFVAQFGVNGDPSVQNLWSQLRIPDDPVVQKNLKGYLSYAKTGPNTRTTQVFINLADNPSLDRTGFAPFGRVVEGMDVVERLWNAYGEVAPRGGGPDPTKIELEGNAYLERSFPRLDAILKARILTGETNR